MWAAGRPAEVLSEFYASVFAQILQASQSASRLKFEHAIECVRNVRDAWRQVARDPGVNPAPVQVLTRNSGRGRRALRATITVGMPVPGQAGTRKKAYPATVSSSSSCCF